MEDNMAEKWISYLRVSTGKQGKSGLGIEAQRAAVAAFLNGGKRVKEFVEVESGKRADRPQLEAAFAACRLYGAKLLIAKLDRLSRDAHFLLGLEKAGIDFVAADTPFANRLTVGVMALMAEQEGRAISKRTKEALAAAKARGTKLGGQRRNKNGKLLVITKKASALGRETLIARADARAADLAPAIKALQASGAESQRAIARGLNEQGIPTSKGNGEWSAAQVARVLERIS
jgi:DNA invertase Pin-like site-specific DNA recombinase